MRSRASAVSLGEGEDWKPHRKPVPPPLPPRDTMSLAGFMSWLSHLQTGTSVQFT